jgi:PAS domain-containing protein
MSQNFAKRRLSQVAGIAE